MKRYKPKTWFIYTRLFVVFLIIFALSRTTNVVYSIVSTDNNNEAKALEHAVIEDNKEDIYYAENPVMAKYTNVPEKGFNVTNDNIKYTLSEEDYNLLVAVISGECNKNYVDDILAVTSVILNRSDNGYSPVEVISRPGQFAVYFEGLYYKYLPGGSDYYRTALVQEVVTDALNGIRNNDYYNFRSWNSYSYSDNYVVEGGNRFGFR